EGFYQSPSLPDGTHFLFSSSAQETGEPEIRIGSLSGTGSTALLAHARRAAYSLGHVLFARDSVLMAQPFDAVSLKLTGEMSVLTQSVFEASAKAVPFSVSENGTLIYRSDKPALQMVWFDRSGKQLAAEP